MGYRQSGLSECRSSARQSEPSRWLCRCSAELYLDISKIDAGQNVALDPSRTWNWNGAAITTFESSVSFERAELGLIGRSQLNDWMALRYGVALRRFLFDGDIVTDANMESLNSDSLWLAPEVGVTFGLPWE